MKIQYKYPGFVSRAITFSIDDGNLEMDRKFIDIVKPHGIRGTFNLIEPHLDRLDAEGYREFYRGFEISNHVKWHPLAMADGVEYEYADAPAVQPVKGSRTKLYPIPADNERCGHGYGIYFKDNDWMRFMVDVPTYLRLTAECRTALEEVFGEGSIGGFVWPYGEQNNAELFRALTEAGYYGLRKTGCTRDADAFAVPRDRMRWSYNANHLELLDVAALYEALPEDGELKLFCFGVHSVDFERSQNWCDLEAFAERFGDRPDTYYYATVGEIFAYADAAAALDIAADEIRNSTDLPIYLTVDGENLVVAPHSAIALG